MWNRYYVENRLRKRLQNIPPEFETTSEKRLQKRQTNVPSEIETTLTKRLRKR